MERDIRDSKNIVKYIEGRYGKFHNQTFGDDITLIESIKKDHTYEHLNMMKRRIDASISIKKDSFSLTINPLTLLPVFLTLFISIVIGYTSVNSNVLLSYFTNSVNINKENLNQADLEKILISLDHSDLFDIIMKYFGLISVVIVFAVGFWGVAQIKNTTKLYSCSLLLQESIDLKEKELGAEKNNPS